MEVLIQNTNTYIKDVFQIQILLKVFKYRMEGNFGGCKLWRNGKENIIGGINFGGLMMKFN